MRPAPETTVTTPPARCLNCGSPLHGVFCSACGQRAIGAYPTIGELVGDAWQELSGYDGRFIRSLRVLLGHPGALTLEFVEGRRIRYISPIRLYLVASLAYFLCAAAVPNLRQPRAPVLPRSTITIPVGESGPIGLSPEEREAALKRLERAPWWAQAVLRPAIVDPAGFRDRFREALPRVLFALVPVFAAIVGLFYRRRRFTQHLVFALHLHTAVFILMGIRELSQLARSLVVLGIFEVGAMLAVVAYGLIAFRTVYGESWPRIVGKAAAIAGVYWVAGICALLATTLWTVVRG